MKKQLKLDLDENIEEREKSRLKRPLKDYEIDLGERGIYTKKNKLNDLTGTEWIYFLNSVWETALQKDIDLVALLEYLRYSVIDTRYATSGKDSYGHELRKQHPSPKPPQLMKDIIRFFTKENGYILDPFMGVGGTLIGASLLENRNAVGIELEEKYIDIYKKVCLKNNIKEQETLSGDSASILESKKLEGETFDLILTDPPYANMLSRKRTGGDRKDKGSFTDKDNDLGNMEFNKFLIKLRGIIASASKLLKNKGYIVIFCKDLQPTPEYNGFLHNDIVNTITKIPNIYFKGYKIWYDKTLNLYPYGYPFSYVSNQLHQFILIFRKEL